MANLQDTLLFSSALWVILKRLDRATSSGGCLHGMKWHREGTAQNDSASSLPSLQPVFVEFDSNNAIGAPKDPQDHDRRSNLPVYNSFTVRLRLRTDTKHGFVRRDPASATEKLGHLEWAGMILDAIELGDDGLPDSCLEQTTRGPVSFAMREPDTTSLSTESIIEIIFNSRGHCRGQRGHTFPLLGDTNIP